MNEKFLEQQDEERLKQAAEEQRSEKDRLENAKAALIPKSFESFIESKPETKAKNEGFEQSLSQLAANPIPPKPKTALAMNAPNDSVDRNPESQPQNPAGNLVMNTIARKYGFGDGLDDKALQQAKADAKGHELISGLGNAVNTISNSLAYQKPSEQSAEFFQNQAKQGQEGMKDILDRRAAQIQNQQVAKYQESNDPNSAQSKVLRDTLNRLYPGQFKPGDLDNVAAGDMDLVFKPLQLKEQIEARKAQQAATNAYHQQNLSLRDDQLEQRNADRIHRTVIEKIKSDPTLAKPLQQYRNLDNALSQVINAKTLTPQQVDEFQQAIRANLGIKSGSGIGERERTQFNTLGLNAERFKQFITGNPADIAKDSVLVQHLKDLAAVEQNNIKQQAHNRLNVLTSGYGSIYKRHPEYQTDLEDAAKAAAGQFSGGSASEGRQPQNNLSPEDQQAIEWAKSNPGNSDAASILKLHGM